MRIIRKYPNRRLYDTGTGQFIKLTALRDLVVAGIELRVEDKTTGEDITRSLLLQVIMEAEEEGKPMLSESLLTDLIRLHEHPMHDYMSPYLERSVALLSYQIEQAHAQIDDLMTAGPLQAWQNYAREGMNWFSEFMPPPNGEDDKPKD